MKDILENYPGNKEMQGMVETIINEIPPHNTYIEGFAGSASVFMRKQPAALGSFLVDIDQQVTRALTERCEKAIVITGDFLVELPKILKHAGEPFRPFFFLDPPYPIEYRRSDRKLYRNELSLEYHEALLDAVDNIEYPVMLCSNPNPLYEEKLQRWRYIKRKVSYNGKPGTEVLWMNYCTPDELHEYTYLGKNALDRQRIGRKIERRLEGIMKLPAQERNALLQRISALPK